MKILLLLLAAFNLLFADFTRNNVNETVYDSDANLTWQDNAIVALQTLNWQAATDYCDTLVFAGRDDWRLPDINELRSIVDDVLPINPAFSYLYQGSYWSSSTETGKVLTIYFVDGFEHAHSESDLLYVRCAYDGQIVNSAPSDLNISNVAIPENSPTGTAIGTLAATDADVGDTFGYSLTCNGATGQEGNFSIEGATLKNAAVFDYETRSSYSICVKVTDSFTLSYEENLTVTITNVLEAAMSVELEPANILLMGTTPTDTQLHKTFTVRNSGEAGSLLTFNAVPLAPSVHFTLLPPSAAIAGGAAQTFDVNFTSSDAGSYSMSVMLLGGASPYPLTFSARAIAPLGADGDLDGTDDALDLWPDDMRFALDSDADGLPDEWETQDYGNLTTATAQDFSLYLQQSSYREGSIEGYNLGFGDGNQSGYDQGTSDTMQYCYDTPELCGIRPKAVVIPMF